MIFLKMSNYKNKIELSYPRIISKKIILDYYNDDYNNCDYEYDYWDKYIYEYDYWDDYVDPIYVRNEKIDILLGVITDPKFGDIIPHSLIPNFDIQ